MKYLNVYIHFTTNSTTGMVAPLNNMIASFLDEEQPNRDAIVRFFKRESHSYGGSPISSGINSSTTIN